MLSLGARHLLSGLLDDNLGPLSLGELPARDALPVLRLSQIVQGLHGFGPWLVVVRLQALTEAVGINVVVVVARRVREARGPLLRKHIEFASVKLDSLALRDDRLSGGGLGRFAVRHNLHLSWEISISASSHGVLG